MFNYHCLHKSCSYQTRAKAHVSPSVFWEKSSSGESQAQGNSTCLTLTRNFLVMDSATNPKQQQQEHWQGTLLRLYSTSPGDLEGRKQRNGFGLPLVTWPLCMGYFLWNAPPSFSQLTLAQGSLYQRGPPFLTSLDLLVLCSPRILFLSFRAFISVCNYILITLII